MSRVRNLMGCNMSVRRSVLQAVGASDDQEVPVPTGAVLVDVGGVRFWSFGAP